MKFSLKKLRRLNLSFLLCLSYLIVIVICILTYYKFLRIDLNKYSEFSISSNSKNLISNIKKPTNIYLIIQEKHQLYMDLQNIIEEYSFYSDKLNIFWTDPVKNPSKTEELIYLYKLNSYPALVIDNGIRSRVIYDEELRETDSSENTTIFKAERVISSAIFEINNKNKPKIYFTTGNGENLLDDLDDGGYSSINIDLETQSIDLKSFNLDGYNSIPSDASAVVVAGPKRMLSKASLNVLEGYLNSSGRLLVLLDSNYESGLDEILKKWGVSLTSGFVFDEAQTLKGRDVNINNYGKHEITNEIDFLVKLLLPRAIIPISKPNNKDVDLPKVSMLLRSSNDSWIEMSSLNQYPKYNELDGDILGPIHVGVAIERGVVQELDVEIPSSKIVLIGDSDFINNANIIDGNKDFFRRSINWLIDRNNQLDISYKNIKNIKISTSSQNIKANFIIFVFVIPFSILIIGIMILIWRRK